MKMVRIKIKAIVFIMVFFISALVFPQENQVDPVEKLREEILGIYKSKGEDGFRRFIEKIKGNINNKFIAEFARYGSAKRNEEVLKICLIMAEEKKEKMAIADVYYSYGWYYYYLSEREKAFDFYDKALLIYQKLKNNIGQGDIYTKKGEMYASSGDYDAANEMYDRALSLFESVDDLFGQGQVYNLKGVSYFLQSNNSEAIKLYKKALPFYEKLKNLYAQGQLYLDLSQSYFDKGDNTNAMEMCKKAIALSERAGDLLGQGNAYWCIGKIYLATDNILMALQMNEKALFLFEQLKNPLGQCNVYTSIGNIYYQTGDNTKALEMYNKALTLSGTLENTLNKGIIYYRMSGLYEKMGKQSTANEMLKKALHFFEKSENLLGQGNVYQELGNIYLYTSDFSKAIEMFNKSLIFLKKAESPSGLGFVHNSKGAIYYYTGDSTRAIEEFDKALSYFEKAENSIGMGSVYWGKGGIYLFYNDNSKAHEMYEKAIYFFEKAQEPLGTGNAYKGKGNVYLNTGNNALALEMYDKAFSYFKQIEEPLGMGNVFLSKAEINFKNADYSISIELFDKAIEFYSKIEDIKSESYALFWKAQALAKLSKKDEALRLLEKAISILERIRSQAVALVMKRFYMEINYDQYAETVLFILENKYDEKGFKYAESMKARVFLDQMAEGLVPLEKGLKPELKEERDNLVGTLSALSRQMQETPGKEEKKLLELREEYHRVDTQFEDLLIKIRLENPLYASVNYPQPVSVRDLQTDVLKKGETLLSYFLAPEKAYAFIVTRENFKVKPLPVNEKDINQYVELHLRALKENNPYHLKRYGSLLYKKLFKPLERYLKKSRDIIIVPNGPLEMIPFESLIVSRKNPERPAYLLEKYRLKYIQGASLLSILRKNYTSTGASTAKSFVGFGDPVYDYENFKQGKPEKDSMKIFATETTEDTESIFSHEETQRDTKGKRLSSVPSVSSVAADSPQGVDDEIKEVHRDRYARAGGIMYRLPNSGEEIQSIAHLFEKKSLKAEVLLREQALEENAKAANMKDFAYIHFSCHGLLNDDFQSLVLSQLPREKSTEDGYFSLNEIMNCDYNAQLVVLSACETGTGKMVKGEGVTGLTRAFMYAGSPAVVASLWKVDDEATKELMLLFYRNLLGKNLEKADALRQAKLEMLKSKKYHSPLFWSAFVMYGE